MKEGPHVEKTPENEEGSQQAADLAELEAMAGGEEGQGAPAAQQSQQEAQTIPTVALLAPLVAMLCNIAAPAWNISREEQEALSGAYAAVVDHYFPDISKAGPVLGAVMVTAMVVGPRWNLPRHDTPKEEKTEKSAPPVTLQEQT